MSESQTKMLSSLEPKLIHLKAHFKVGHKNVQPRRIGFESSSFSFADLSQWVDSVSKEVFGAALEQNKFEVSKSLFYIDNEREWVKFTSDLEWKEAVSLSSANGNQLVLLVQFTVEKSKQQVEEEEEEKIAKSQQEGMHPHAAHYREHRHHHHHHHHGNHKHHIQPRESFHYNKHASKHQVEEAEKVKQVVENALANRKTPLRVLGSAKKEVHASQTRKSPVKIVPIIIEKQSEQKPLSPVATRPSSGAQEEEEAVEAPVTAAAVEVPKAVEAVEAPAKKAQKVSPPAAQKAPVLIVNSNEEEILCMPEIKSVADAIILESGFERMNHQEEEEENKVLEDSWSLLEVKNQQEEKKQKVEVTLPSQPAVQTVVQQEAQDPIAAVSEQKKDYSKELAILESMGFNQKALNQHLLNYHKGSMEKVVYALIDFSQHKK